MYSPFKQGANRYYSGLSQCIMRTIEGFNRAADRAVGIVEGCSICQDTLGAAEGDPPSHLSMVILESCKHQFHEYCLMEWLSPIFLPTMVQGLDPLVRLLEERSNLEEGEIRGETEAQIAANRTQFTQTLYPVNPFIDPQATREVPISELRGPMRARTCPHCRQCTFLGPISCYADTIQLIRARLRLTNLAYQCFGFKRTQDEEEQRRSIQSFLRRRCQDNDALALEDTDAWTLNVDGPRHVFKQARLSLREEDVFRYKNSYLLTAIEQLRLLQLAAFFESFDLCSWDADLFFNPSSVLDLDWSFSPSAEEYGLLNVDPAAFCKDIMFFCYRRRSGSLTSHIRPPSIEMWSTALDRS